MSVATVMTSIRQGARALRARLAAVFAAREMRKRALKVLISGIVVLWLFERCDRDHTIGTYALRFSGAVNDERTGEAEGRDGDWIIPDDPYLMGLDVHPPGVPVQENYGLRLILTFPRGGPEPGRYAISYDSPMVFPPNVATAFIYGGDETQIWRGDSGTVRVTKRRLVSDGISADFDLYFTCRQSCPCAEREACRVRATGRLDTK